MTYQEPINNIVRGTIMGMSAVLAGVQSMGISAYDEALSVPSEQAHQQSIRAQQILMHETNLAAVTDPLGGSYYVESLTSELEQRAYAFMDEIENAGGFIAALESGFLHGVASENQLRLEEMLGDGRREIVAVNVHTSDHDPFGIDGFQGSIDAWERGMERLEKLRDERDSDKAKRAIGELESVCENGGNVMDAVMTAVGDDVTVGEVGEVFRSVFGSWKFPVSF
jgi:methylmalonyl-CoA mutase N-terminal domain/subunit